MAHQYSVEVRDDQANVIQTRVGTAAKLQIRTGDKPANCAAADVGDLIAEITLPATWLTTASGTGAVAKAGTWSGAAALAGTNTAGHFRIKDNGLAACHLQGSITATGGGGDMELDAVSVAQGQVVTVTAFTITRGNA